MPTAMVDAMNPGGLLGLTNAAMQAQNEPRPGDAPPTAVPATPTARKRR
jgi:hypothetical protein